MWGDDRGVTTPGRKVSLSCPILGMKEKYYREILASLDESLKIMGDLPPDAGSARRVYKELRKLRETLIRAQRDTFDKNVKGPGRRDSRSPLGAM